MRYFLLKILLIALFVSSPLFGKGPDFSLRDLDGNLVRLSDYLDKGPVILDFWATWCKPCLKVLPKLEELYNEYEDRGLTVLAINQDGTQSASKVEPFVNSMGLTFPVLLDKEQELVRLYQVSGFPTTILLDKKGNIVETLRGYRPGDEQKLKDKVKALLGEEKE